MSFCTCEKILNVFNDVCGICLLPVDDYSKESLDKSLDNNTPIKRYISLETKYFALQSKNSELTQIIKDLRGHLKIAQKDERERIYEDAGCPGFDGPMNIETKYDKIIAETYISDFEQEKDD